MWEVMDTREYGYTLRGKDGGTTAHPEIAMAFRAWLFPEFMMELVKWYRMYQHEE